MHRYMLTISPSLSRKAARSERRTMVLATMVALWDVVAMATTVLLILASLLLVLLITVHSLVALYYNWRILLPALPW